MGNRPRFARASRPSLIAEWVDLVRSLSLEERMQLPLGVYYLAAFFVGSTELLIMFG